MGQSSVHLSSASPPCCSVTSVRLFCAICFCKGQCFFFCHKKQIWFSNPFEEVQIKPECSYLFPLVLVPPFAFASEAVTSFCRGSAEHLLQLLNLKSPICFSRLVENPIKRKPGGFSPERDRQRRHHRNLCSRGSCSFDCEASLSIKG